MRRRRQGRRAHASAPIVAYVMLDYSALSFISSQSPYYEFFRVPRTTREGTRGQRRRADRVRLGPAADLHVAEPLVAAHRRGLQHAPTSRGTGSGPTLARGDGVDRVYVSNDRNGIYVVGYPVMTPFTHLVNLGELTAFAALLFVVLVALTSLLRSVIGAGRLAAARSSSGDPRQLLPQAVHRLRRRDARAGAGARAARPRLGRQPAAAPTPRPARRARRSPRSASSRSRWRCSSASSPAPPSAASTTTSWCGSAASSTRTSTSSTRSDAARHQRARPVRLGPAADADAGAGATAPSPSIGCRPTSARIASATSPTSWRRRRSASAAATASSPCRWRCGSARSSARSPTSIARVLLGALMLILLGAGLGYWMAERIGDPVQRLTRATRRIAAGDLEHPRHRADRRRAAAPRRGVQPHGRRAAAAAQPGRAHAPPRGLGRDGAPGRARHQEPADADPALGRAPAARAPRSRRAALAGARHLRRHDPHAGAAAAADRVGVLELRLVADRAAGARRRSPICCARSSIPTSSASRDRVAIDARRRARPAAGDGRSDAAVARA